MANRKTSNTTKPTAPLRRESAVARKKTAAKATKTTKPAKAVKKPATAKRADPVKVATKAHIAATKLVASLEKQLQAAKVREEKTASRLEAVKAKAAAKASKKPVLVKKAA